MGPPASVLGGPPSLDECTAELTVAAGSATTDSGKMGSTRRVGAAACATHAIRWRAHPHWAPLPRRAACCWEQEEEREGPAMPLELRIMISDARDDGSSCLMSVLRW